jgi:hypothetical protein
MIINLLSIEDLYVIIEILSKKNTVIDIMYLTKNNKEKHEW